MADCNKTLSVDCVEYFDSKFSELEKRLNLRNELVDKALEKAEIAMGHRLDNMNQFREQLTKQAATFVEQKEFDYHTEAIAERISTLTKIVYIGMGVFLTIQILWQYIKI
jgi:hypothetical protein